MNPKRTTLAVKPLKKYKKAVYPSWEEPSPLLHPEMLPYPLSKRVSSILKTSGVLSCLAMMHGACSGGNERSHQEQVQEYVDSLKQFFVENAGWRPDTLAPDSTGNIFSLGLVRLPFVVPWFGVGSGERLNQKDASYALDQAFELMEIPLQHNFEFNEEGVHCVLDGYDPISKMGYIYLDNTKLTADLYIGIITAVYSDWHVMRGNNPMPNLLINVDTVSEDVKYKAYENVLQNHEWKYPRDSHPKSKRPLSEYDPRWKFPKWLYEKAQKALSESDPIIRKKEIFETVSVIDYLAWVTGEHQITLSNYAKQRDKDGTLPFSRDEIRQIADIIMYIIHFLPEEQEVSMHDRLLGSSEEVQAFIKEISVSVDKQQLNKAELSILDKMNREGRLHIATINGFDGRFSYDRSRINEMIVPIEQIKKEMFGPLPVPINKNAMPPGSKRYSLKKLELAAMMFIDWAKNQGLSH